jgi:hypothetical protein
LRCVSVLSLKSSGSRALQIFLCNGTIASHVEHTRHGDHETLYWSKMLRLRRSPS